jgi:hypothetical protein
MTVLSPPQIAAYAKQAGFTGSQVAIMTAIALAESSGRTDATNHNSNGSVDHGLWQINDVNSSILRSGNWANPADNARMAFQIYQQQGYRAWSVFKSGSYAKHLVEANAAAGTPASNIAPDPLTPMPAPPDDGGLSAALSFITNPHTWLRLGMMLAGGVLVIMGLVLIGWESAPQSIKNAAKSAAKAAAVA